MVRFEDVKTEKHFGLFIDEFWIIWIPVKYQFNQVSYRSKFNTSQNIYLLLIVMVILKILANKLMYNLQIEYKDIK